MNKENSNIEKNSGDTEVKTQDVQPAPEEQASAAVSGRGKARDGRKPHGKRREVVPSEFVEQVVAINRITKVTKGGKKLSFSALVVVGDTKGRVGYSLAKANEVAIAIKKSLIAAKKNMIRVAMHQSTITHQIIGVCGAASVLLKPAAEGTGVIAAGPVRAVCDSAGIRNILTKCHRSNNPINVVKATMDGLLRLKPRPAVETDSRVAPGVKENVSA